MLISPTEPQRLREIGTTSSTPEKFGADFLILGRHYRIGVQRKQFPGDLLASLADGRLYQQLPALADLEAALLVVEGLGKWTEDGELIDQDFHRFSLQQLNGLFFSVMFEFRIPVYWVKDITATELLLTNLEVWAGKESHNSLRQRPGPPRGSWGNMSDVAFAQHIIQGFPGVGPELSLRILKHFGTIPLAWSVTPAQLAEVPGIGKKKASAMHSALDVQLGDDDEG